ncbi:uncharacterized protein [Ambystoma mexicanum]|uniref:uncharacterized protein n=1 Tax=Ambystoma mexicanum TaxID=8296 RepID=UPI0037E70903
MDETTDSSMTGEDMTGDGSAAEAELEEEEFLRWLTPEERECLQYLLETIKSLEAGLGEDGTEDGPSSEFNSGENAHDYPDGKVESSNASRLSRLESEPMSSEESEKSIHTTSLLRNDPKAKLSKSLSADSTGDPATAGQESLNKLIKWHPSYLRKFDTIMRSGVNVQELRARFVSQHGSPALEEDAKGTDPPSSSKTVLLFQGGHTSPREKALQKLGLLKRNQTIRSATSSPEAYPCQVPIPQAAVPTAGGLTGANEDSVPSFTADSAASSSSSDDVDHQEALKKLRLLHL